MFNTIYLRIRKTMTSFLYQDLLRDRANEIIAASNVDTPFYMYFAFPNPHVPLQVNIVTMS